MRKHNGMRPQDIAILLKVISMHGKPWHISGLASSMRISLSEVSESLNRSRTARLLDHQKKTVNKQNLLEFIEHGVRYVFPQEPGAIYRGIPTAHSHPFMKEKFASETEYVWPDSNGDVIGQSIEPFYARQVEASKEDETLYKMLALTDVLRVGRVREINFAIEELKKLVA